MVDEIGLLPLSQSIESAVFGHDGDYDKKTGAIQGALERPEA